MLLLGRLVGRLVGQLDQMVQLVQELLACRVDLVEMVVIEYGSSSVTVIRHVSVKHSNVKVGICAFINGSYLIIRANAAKSKH